jgi:hypothetical protein
MTKLNFLHICETAFLAKENNNLSIINIFDQIKTQGFPAIHPRFMVVVNLTLEVSGMHTFSLTIVKDFKKIVELNSPYNRTELNMQIIQTFVNFAFPEEGVYSVQVALDGQMIGSKDLTVIKN